MKKYSPWLLIVLFVVIIGAINAILLKVFEILVNDGSNDIWNTLFQSDKYRWVVVPLAIALSIVLTYLIRCFHQKRVVSPETDLMDEINGGPAKLSEIGIILAIGLMSLLAGASLGPEASLMAASVGIGGWAASKAKLGPATKLVILASVGSLLVAFLGSLVMVLVPLLLLYKQKHLQAKPIIVVLAAGVSAFLTIQLIDHQNPGYGTAPTLPSLVAHDFIVALLVGFITTILALALNRLISWVGGYAKRIEAGYSWQTAAGIFGLGIGLLYFFGGQTIEFSGSAGSQQLITHSASYGAMALVWLILTKLLATAWSKATGYRGGLVFPSIYIGIALGLLVGQVHPAWAGSGAAVGGIAGMLSSVTGSSAVAAVFVFAILPVKLFPVAILAIIGSSLGSKLLTRFASKK